MKPFQKLAWTHLNLTLSVLTTLAINTQTATANTVTIRTNNRSYGGTPEMVRPRNYNYGGVGPTYNSRWRNPNIVPYRLSPTPEGSPYFSYPGTNSPSYSRRTEPRQPQQTMGLIYTNQGSLDHFGMYMEWGNIAVQQNQPQVALNWYQKALALRPSDQNAIRSIQSLQDPVRK